MHKLSMEIDFAVVVQDDNGSHLLENNELMSLTVGGFDFEIDGKNIPFDFEDHCISEAICNGNKEKGLWSYTGGEGGFFKSYSLDDCYDEDYIKMGISRDMLSAYYLSKVSKINEIFVEWQIMNFDECDITAENVVLLVQDIRFTDIETGKTYIVLEDVIRDFNEKNVKEKGLVDMSAGMIKDDSFYHYKDTDCFYQVFFNPDSMYGGQFVELRLPYHLILEAEERNDTTDDFFDFLQSCAYCELIDVNALDFVSYMIERHKETPFAVGIHDDTRAALVEVAKSISGGNTV